MVDVAKSAAEDLLDLFRAELKLARLELSGDLRRAIKGVGRVALFIPPLIVGYGFTMAALASWLGGPLGQPMALASVAALQIFVAGIGLLWSLAALRRTRVLERTSAEVADGVRRTIRAVSPATRSLDA